jgi:serine/threonine protein kinase
MADSTSASYAVVRELGKGGEGVVLLVRRRDTDAPHALKRRHSGATIGDANDGLREALALSRVQHEHVVRYDDAWLEERVVVGVRLYELVLVMEYCDTWV